MYLVLSKEEQERKKKEQEAFQKEQERLASERAKRDEEDRIRREKQAKEARATAENDSGYNLLVTPRLANHHNNNKDIFIIIPIKFQIYVI